MKLLTSTSYKPYNPYNPYLLLLLLLILTSLPQISFSTKQTPQKILTLQGNNIKINALIKINDETFATAHENQVIRLWNYSSGQNFMTLKQHSSSVRSLAYVGNNILVSSGDDSLIIIWNISNGSVIKIINEKHKRPVKALFFDGKESVFSGGDEKFFCIWNIQTWSLTKTVNINEPVYEIIRINQDVLAFRLFSNCILLYNTKNENRQFKYYHNQNINAIIGMSNSRLITASDDWTMRIYDMTDMYNDKYINNFKGHEGIVRSLCRLKNSLFASGSDDNSIKIWDSDKKSLIKTLTGHVFHVNFLLNLKENVMISVSKAEIYAWDLTSYKKIKTISSSSGHSLIITSMLKVSNDLIMTSSMDTTIKLWNISSSFSGQNRNQLTLSGHSDSVTSIVFIGNNRIASGSYDKTIKIWDFSTGFLIKTLYGHEDYVNCLVYLGQNQLASGSDDGTIKIWNTETGSLIMTLEGHESYVSSLVYIEDKQILASAGYDNLVILWKLSNSTGTIFKKLISHTDIVATLAYIGNNQLASGGNDQLINIWNINTGEKELFLNILTRESVTCICNFGNRIFGSVHEEFMYVWDMKNRKRTLLIKDKIKMTSLLYLGNDMFAVSNRDASIDVMKVNY